MKPPALPCLHCLAVAACQVMPNVTQRFEGSSTYKRDFGPLGSDPMQHATRVASQQTLLSTTRELNDGTTRAAHHPPGYTGFVPAAATNPGALEQASGTSCRPDAKVSSVAEYHVTIMTACHTCSLSGVYACRDLNYNGSGGVGLGWNAKWLCLRQAQLMPAEWLAWTYSYARLNCCVDECSCCACSKPCFLQLWTSTHVVP